MRVFHVGLLAAAGPAFSGLAWAELQDVPIVRSFPKVNEYSNLNCDRSDQLKVVGHIEAVETEGGETIVWVRVDSVTKQGFGGRPGTEAPGKGMIWRVVGPGLGKIKDQDRARLIAGAEIAVSGVNGADKTCKPTCRISSSRVTLK